MPSLLNKVAMSNPPNKKDAVQPLPKGLVRVGEPIKHPIYDQHGKLLLQVGTIVSSESQLEKLYERGLYLNIPQEEHVSEPESAPSNSAHENTERKTTEKPETGKLTDLSLNGINIGESLQITPLADESANTRYLIKYLGGLDKKSLICTLPEVNERIVYVKEHSGFKVQLFSGKDVYSFTTIVEAVYNRPYPHMHLKFPRDVYSKNLRKNQRIQANIITSLLNKNPGAEENKKTAGRIVDLSLGGAMVESIKTAGQVNDELECSFKIAIDGDEAFLVVPSVIRNIMEASDAKNQPIFKHGLQFKDMSFQDRIILQSFIFQSITGKKLDDL
jgi:c-di-GMP-binding flagellar brake protein YcgR